MRLADEDVGAPRNVGATGDVPPGVPISAILSANPSCLDTSMINTSGQGTHALVPVEVDRWNWGAFLMHWMWGLGNNTMIALLMWVPLVNLVMPFVLGAKGSAWAWRNKRWDSVDHFRRVQRIWAVIGLILWFLMGLFIAGMVLLFFVIGASMKQSEAFRMSVDRLQANEAAITYLGEPLETGFVMGNISTNSGTGEANINYWIGGPKGEGRVYVEAVKRQGLWTITSAAFVPDDGVEAIQLEE